MPRACPSSTCNATGAMTASRSRSAVPHGGLAWMPAPPPSPPRALAAEVGAAGVRFALSDVPEAPAALPQEAGRQDLVFTGRGTIAWLPDIGRWARPASCWTGCTSIPVSPGRSSAAVCGTRRG